MRRTQRHAYPRLQNTNQCSFRLCQLKSEVKRSKVFINICLAGSWKRKYVNRSRLYEDTRSGWKNKVCNHHDQYLNTLKDNCLVWNVIGWSDKRSIIWLREHTKLRTTGKYINKGTAEKPNKHSAVAVFTITLFLGVLTSIFVN